jgi:hypothetical protein
VILLFILEDYQDWIDQLKEMHIVVAEFYQPQNPHCEKLSKIIDLNFFTKFDAYQDGEYIKVDIKKFPMLVKQYHIEEVPTIILFHHEQPVKVVNEHLIYNIKREMQLTGFHKDIPQYILDLLGQLHQPSRK